MTRAIIDSSIATAWCSRSQATPISDAAFEAAIEHGALVPARFALEVANSLWQLERRGRIATAAVDEFFAHLARIAIEVDPVAASIVQAAMLNVARKHDLTVYDAAYLELALRTGLPLATRDGALARATREAGATLFAP
jgi:predicted nucleic acid-binding protein